MKFRKALFWTHLAAGLAAGGVILSMAASGLLLSFQPQIAAWAERGVRTVESPAPGTARRSLDALAAKAAEVTSKGRINTVTVKSDPRSSVSISFGREGGGVYLDPHTGEVLGRDSRIQAALKTVENWHRWLGAKEIGQPVTGAVCLLFFFQLLSGLYLWWPRNRTRAAFRAAAVPGLGLKGKARDWNWHNSVGLWAAPLLLITTVTGTIIAYRWAGDLLFVFTGNPPPPRPQEEGPRSAGKPGRKEAARPGRNAAALPLASLDSLWAKAEKQVPVWSSISLRLPQKPGGAVTVSIIEPGFMRRHARSQLSLDASTASITKWEPYAEQNLGRRLRAWVVPLHTGRAGGPAGQFLAALSAAAAILLVYTGISLAWRRFRKPAGKSQAEKPQPVDSTVESIR